MKILLIQPRRIGDVLLVTPVIAYIKQCAPHIRIGLLVEKSVVPLLQGNPHLDELIVYDKSKPISEMMRIRSMRFDALADFMSNPRTAYLSFASGAQWRASWASFPRSLFYNLKPVEAPAEYAPLKKIRLINEIFARVGVQPQVPFQVRPRIYLTDAERQGARDWFRVAGVQPHDFVVIAPAFRHANRGWSLNHYRTVAMSIVEKLNKKVFLFWGPGEESIVAQVRAGVEAQVELLPKTSMREAAALFEQALLVLTNDSGAKHTAIAVDTPTVALYGPTKPIDWNPSLSKAGPWDIPLPMSAGPDDVFQACQKIVKEKTYGAEPAIG